MTDEEAKKTRADCVRVIKECLIFYTTFAFALLAIFRYVWIMKYFFKAFNIKL
jgi:hypothetical protein